MTQAHDPWLVLLAGFIALIGSNTSLRLYRRVADTRASERWAWLVLTVLVTGATIWCTHFVAMLGFDPEVPVGFDPVLTIASLLVAMLGTAAGFAITTLPYRVATPIGGAVVGLTIAAMHFSGMLGYRVQGIVSWDEGFLAASIALSTILAAVAVTVVRRVETVRGSYAGTALFGLAIVALHFVGMAAFRVEPMAVDGSFSNPGALQALAFSVAGVALVVMGAGFATYTIDDRARLLSIEAVAYMSNGLAMISRDERVILSNRRAAEIFHLADDDLRPGMTLSAFLGSVGAKSGWDGERVGRVLDTHRQWLLAAAPVRVEHEFEGGRVVDVRYRPLPRGGGILTYEDITEARVGQRKVAHMAYHDALTGLANRRLFAETIQGLVEADRSTLLMVDLDRFKAVNDKLGHALGDELLVQVAERLTHAVGQRGLVFRLGGDEFAILRSGSVEEAEALGTTIIAALSSDFEVGGHVVRIGCSVGVARASGNAEGSLLQRHADLALYKAKNEGRARVEIYCDGMMEQAAEHRSFQEELSLALERGQLELHFQPLYGLAERSLDGFEALVRWRHPTFGHVPPTRFIPVAEASGLIERIGGWVIDEACRHAASWPENLGVSINVSAVQLRSPLILRQLQCALESHGLAPNRVEIEVTETAMMEASNRTSATFAGFRALGVRVAIDDFGTGYSSLAHLRDFQVDRIKIDRSFVATVEADPGAAAVVRAVTRMARDLSIETTAEGIETQGQLDTMIAFGCGMGQGYLLGRPMDGRSATGLVADEVREAV